MFQEISNFFKLDDQFSIVVVGNLLSVQDFINYSERNNISIIKAYVTDHIESNEVFVSYTKEAVLDANCQHFLFLETGLDTFELIDLVTRLKQEGKKCYSFQNQSLQKLTFDFLVHLENKKYNSAFLPQLKDKIVCIVGVGSIGFELLKDIVKYELNHIILIDNSELSLFQAKVFLKKINHDAEFILSDVNDKAFLNHVFEKYKPQIIIHTAAYKHVSLVQENIISAIKTNIFGLKNLTDLAIKHKAEKFLFISSDKAVNPISVLGATKRIGEQYILSLANYTEKMQEEHCLFSLVRFGNVLGSSGSVVPVFLEQMQAGNIEVTHPDMKRFFVSKKELSWLLLQAVVKMKGNELFLVDNKQEIKIVDLAEKMIIIEDSKAEIIFGKPLKSEKLNEELLHETDLIEESFHKNVKIVSERIHHSFIDLTEDLKLLENAVEKFESVRAIEIINTMLR